MHHFFNELELSNAEHIKKRGDRHRLVRRTQYFRVEILGEQVDLKLVGRRERQRERIVVGATRHLGLYLKLEEMRLEEVRLDILRIRRLIVLYCLEQDFLQLIRGQEDFEWTIAARRSLTRFGREHAEKALLGQVDGHGRRVVLFELLLLSELRRVGKIRLRQLTVHRLDRLYLLVVFGARVSVGLRRRRRDERRSNGHARTRHGKLGEVGRRLYGEVLLLGVRGRRHEARRRLHRRRRMRLIAQLHLLLLLLRVRSGRTVGNGGRAEVGEAGRLSDRGRVGRGTARNATAGRLHERVDAGRGGGQGVVDARLHCRRRGRQEHVVLSVLMRLFRLKVMQNIKVVQLISIQFFI